MFFLSLSVGVAQRSPTAIKFIPFRDGILFLLPIVVVAQRPPGNHTILPVSDLRSQILGGIHFFRDLFGEGEGEGEAFAAKSGVSGWIVS